MHQSTRAIVHDSAASTLAALVLLVLIALPFTAPFRAVHGGALTPSSVEVIESGEAGATDAIQQVPVVFAEPVWHVISMAVSVVSPIAGLARDTQVLRL